MVTLRHGNDAPVRFAATAGRSVVRSAAAAGYALTTGCLQGRCAICRARLLTGEVAALRRRSKHALADPARRADGCVLLCSVEPCSDLELEALSPWRPMRSALSSGPA